MVDLSELYVENVADVQQDVREALLGDDLQQDYESEVARYRGFHSAFVAIKHRHQDGDDVAAEVRRLSNEICDSVLSDWGMPRSLVAQYHQLLADCRWLEDEAEMAFDYDLD